MNMNLLNPETSKQDLSVERKIIYADHGATTKIRAEVLEIMTEVLSNNFGNPSSIHTVGKKSREIIEIARESLAKLVNAEANQIYFTSGGTESDNAVILGLARLFEKSPEQFKNKQKKIITSKIEHPAVKEPLEYLQNKGWDIKWVDVDKEGFLNLDQLTEYLTSDVLLVSVIHANNEIGTIQDIKTISRLCRQKNILFHTDAIQSVGKIPVDLKELEADFLSMSAHKIYGPKGVGALYIKADINLLPLQFGGGQENNIKPGTENVPGIAGFGEAARLIKNELKYNAEYLSSLQIKLFESLSEVKKLIPTGPSVQKIKENFSREKYLYRVPGHVSFCTDLMEGESLVLQLDLRKIASSSGSACRSREVQTKNARIEPSHVLLACGFKENIAKGSLRLTFGRDNTEEDILYIAKCIKGIIDKS